MPASASSLRLAGLAAVALAGLAAAACAPSSGAAGAAEPSRLVMLADGVEVPATVHAAAFERSLLGFGMPGYHLLVAAGGKAAGASLFVTPVSDSEILDTFETLGAKPGDALGMDTWEERESPASPAPDRVIEGPSVEVTVWVPGRAEPLALGDFLTDPGGKGFAMRLGGHRANIPLWGSGCGICLYSCPGAKVGNARYTVREWMQGTTRFRVRPGTLPADGSTVTLRLRLVPTAGEAEVG
ncbi:MAG TPA: YdjY domain-containing protein [Thermoanaerobaculia bacterium]|nr:YdjY domain-containing protein [Thermoanaerobaculia bacterium]